MMHLCTCQRILLYLYLLFASCSLSLSHSVEAEDVNAKLLTALKSYMNPKEDPCERFYHYACGNWENTDNHYDLIDNIGSLDFAFNQKIEKLLKERAASHKSETDPIYERLRDYYETCEQRKYLNVTQYLDLIKPADGEDWPAEGESWSPQTKWNLWSSVGNLAALGFNGLFFVLEAIQHNANSHHLTVDQFESVETETNTASYMKFSNNEKAAAMAPKIVEFLDKLSQLHYNGTNVKAEQMSLSDLQKQVEDIDFLAYFSALLGKGDLGEIQLKVKNLNYFRQVGELVKNTPQEILMHALKISLLSYLENNHPGYELHDGCLGQLRKYVPMAVNYLYEREIYERNTTDPVIEKVFKEMQQKFVEIIHEHSDEFSPQEIEYLKEKILKMNLNVGNVAQAVDDQFYVDHLRGWEVVQGDIYRSQLSALRHRATQDYGLVKVNGPLLPLNTFLVLSGGSPYYSDNKNLLTIPFAYLEYPTFHPEFNELFLFAELGNTMGHEIMHGFDTGGIKVAADGNPSDIFVTTNKPKYAEALECLQKTITFSLNEKLADFSGFRLAYDTYFQPSKKAPEYTAGESILTSKQLFFIKFAQFFCAGNEDRITYDSSHDTPFRRVPEVVANNPEFEQVFSCTPKTGAAKVEKCKLW